MEAFHIEKTTPSPPSGALERLLDLTASQVSGLLPQWVPELPEILAEAHFRDVECDRRDAKPHHAFAMHLCNLMIYNMVVAQQGHTKEVEEIRRVVPQVAAESRRGVMVACSRSTIIARKPQEAG